MQNSVEIFSIALGLVEPWYVKELVFAFIKILPNLVNPKQLKIPTIFKSLSIQFRCNGIISKRGN